MSDSPEPDLAEVLEHDVRALLRAMQGSAVEEIRLERGGRRISLRRTLAPPDAAPLAGAGGATGATGATGASDLAKLVVPGRTEVRAQVVGVFHRARAIDGPALAAEGDVVDAGQPVGVIETLGIANDVVAAVRGRLTEFSVEDGQAVEYGELIAVVVPEQG